MSTQIEDPQIPLVNMDENNQKYSSMISVEMSLKRNQSVGCRLARRKVLFERRRRWCDSAIAMAFIGIILMVIETELTAAKIYTKSSVSSYIVKSAITISTVGLIGTLGSYHRVDIQLFTLDNSIDDWRLAINSERCFWIAMEFLACVIHPIPGNFPTTWFTTTGHGIPSRKVEDVPLDVVLSLPMFFRLYLIFRAIMLHSRLYQGALSQGLGALNRIHFDFRFIFKSLMALHPEYVLLVIMLSLFILASWMLRLCEMYNDSVHSNFLNSMWLIAITFLSVGYGDIVPSSYCGRGIAVITGMMGAGCTALVVAVLARKLELSRSEKFVHDFVLDAYLDKKLQHEAANIMKAGWFIYKTKKVSSRGSDVLKFQRKLLRAVYHIRQIKVAQRRLIDSSVTFVEMNKTQNRMSDNIDIIRLRQLTLEEKVIGVETKLSSIYDTVNNISDMLKSSHKP